MASTCKAPAPRCNHRWWKRAHGRSRVGTACRDAVRSAISRLWQRGHPALSERRPLIFLTLFEIVGYIISVIVMLVIVQFVLSLLISFNVVNIHNDFVAAVYKAVNALLEPLLRPIRRFMPATGSIDFAPLVLIVGLEIVRIILKNLAIASASGAM